MRRMFLGSIAAAMSIMGALSLSPPIIPLRAPVGKMTVGRKNYHRRNPKADQFKRDEARKVRESLTALGLGTNVYKWDEDASRTSRRS